MHCTNATYSAAFLLHMGIGKNLRELRTAANVLRGLAVLLGLLAGRLL